MRTRAQYARAVTARRHTAAHVAREARQRAEAYAAREAAAQTEENRR